MSSDDVEDVRRVLAICFRNGEPLHALDLERILSFDMEWITPDEAESAVQALVAKGWLSGDENALKPTVALEGVRSPLGWFPRPSRLLQPVAAVRDIDSDSVPTKEQAEIVSKVEQAASTPAPKISNSDPRMRLVARLTKFIAKSSEISPEEVERRAQRKHGALGYATTWMCLALVAREQGLAMKEIIEALSTL
tara:strand:- start:1988 stop:2569 length:582 start_codon:yes stop_codon:yes gene_type:complete